MLKNKLRQLQSFFFLVRSEHMSYHHKKFFLVFRIFSTENLLVKSQKTREKVPYHACSKKFINAQYQSEKA